MDARHAEPCILIIDNRPAIRLVVTRFRYYSYATVVRLIVFGVLTSFQIPQMQCNDPTPWMGVKERINIYASMLWVAVLAIGLLRAERSIIPIQKRKRPGALPHDNGKLPA